MEKSAGDAAPRSAMTVRPASDTDLPAVQAIYAHHVLHGTASFEEVPPNLAEMTRRWAGISGRGLPYLVAELDGQVRGFAYAGPYRARPAYRHTLEDSVYVAAAAAGRGLGRRLLDRVITEATGLGYRQMVAVIGDSGNRGSIVLHERAGFRHAGTLRSVGFKFGRWLDTVLMQRALGEGDATLPKRQEDPSDGTVGRMGGTAGMTARPGSDAGSSRNAAGYSSGSRFSSGSVERQV